MQWKDEKEKTKGKNLMPAFTSLIQAKQTCPPLLNTSDETTPRKQEQLNQCRDSAGFTAAEVCECEFAES